MDDGSIIESLVGLPGQGQYGPNQAIHRLARDYMEANNLPYRRIKIYASVDPQRARRIAREYERMAHDPHDPIVMHSYDALIAETLAQYQFVKRYGLVIELTGRGDDPYAATPRLASADINKNKHLFVLSTDDSFGAGETVHGDNPLLAYCDEFVGGQQLRVNDVFRIVHDFFGHTRDGIGFGANGEENAWRSHSMMYSRQALGAMTTELRGQNSWVNYGRYGPYNKKKSAERTIYASQKVGLLPKWCWESGRLDHQV